MHRSLIRVFHCIQVLVLNLWPNFVVLSFEIGVALCIQLLYVVQIVCVLWFQSPHFLALHQCFILPFLNLLLSLAQLVLFSFFLISDLLLLLYFLLFWFGSVGIVGYCLVGQVGGLMDERDFQVPNN